jgi:hypothetical protein
MAKDESKLWQEVKKKITQISFTRLESWASAAKPLGPLAPKLYEGRQIQDLLTLGHVPVAAVAEGWTKVQEHLVNVT